MPTAWLIAGCDAPTPRIATACGMLENPFGTVTPATTPTRSCRSSTPLASISRRSTTPTDTGVVRASVATRSVLTTTSGRPASPVSARGGTSWAPAACSAAQPAIRTAAARRWGKRVVVSGMASGLEVFRMLAEGLRALL